MFTREWALECAAKYINCFVTEHDDEIKLKLKHRDGTHIALRISGRSEEGHTPMSELVELHGVEFAYSPAMQIRANALLRELYHILKIAETQPGALLGGGICIQVKDGLLLQCVFKRLGYHYMFPVEHSILKMTLDEASEFYYSHNCWERDSVQYKARIQLLKQCIEYIKSEDLWK